MDVRRCDAIGEQRPFEIVDARPPARAGRIAGRAKYLISTRYSKFLHTIISCSPGYSLADILSSACGFHEFAVRVEHEEVYPADEDCGVVGYS